MVISKFIGKNCILPELESTNKAAAVRELTHLLYDKKKIPDVAVALDQIVAREREQASFRNADDGVTGPPDPLEKGRNPPGRAQLTDQVHVADVDAELERRGCDQSLEFPSLEAFLGVEPSFFG